jgi:hypothetical protein
VTRVIDAPEIPIVEAREVRDTCHTVIHRTRK